ncbi:unnamed protein product [marine sediment metagenome]|uniref:Uncharacterized protein n=1 Tax=marine sediment metagenome TaxID=412755 RepID=X0U0Q3_9ZZZZ
MAANTFANGASDGTVIFDKPVAHLNVFIASGVTFAISLDKGMNYLSMPAGFHSFRIGHISEVRVQANGVWELIGVQA